MENSSPKSAVNPVTFRVARLGDEQGLALVGAATFLEAFADVLPGEDILLHCRKQHAVEKYAAWLRDGVTNVWIAEATGTGAPVGYLVLTAPELPIEVNPRDREVKRIYLLHRFRGRGVGRTLMDFARDAARREGVNRLLLGVYNRNTAAISFYERLGYYKVGRRSFDVGAHTYEDFIYALEVNGDTNGKIESPRGDA